MEFRRARIVDCRPHPDYTLWILFDDGVSGKVDLENLAGKGVFSAWNSTDFFMSAHVDKKTDTIAWGDDLDLDPYVLREQVISRLRDSLTL